MAADNRHHLQARDARWTCDPKLFGVNDSSQLEPLEQIIGQDRALKAIRLGLEVKSPGYNIFVAGLTGTGRKTTIKQFLEQIETDSKIPGDICYVNNFKNPDLPFVLYLLPGKGSEFSRDMDEMIQELRRTLPRVFESDNFRKKASDALEKHNVQARRLLEKLEKKIQDAGFAIVKVEMGPITRPEILPVVGDKVAGWEEFAQLVNEGKLTDSEFRKIQAKHAQLTEEMQETLRNVRKINRDASEAFAKLRKATAEPLLDETIHEIEAKYNSEKLASYLDEVKCDILENLDDFQSPEDKGTQESPLPIALPTADPFSKFKVNVLVDNSGLKRVPVIIETSPSYKNLFGTIERVVDQSGVWRTDFTKIKAGSLVRASGGFLVLNLLDALVEPGVWTALKRALQNRQIDIQSYDPYYMVNTSGMKPEPISVDVKVVIIGDANYYYRLYYLDDEFQKVFKIRADFDTMMPLNNETIVNYGRFVSRIVTHEGLMPFDKTAMAAVIEYGVRLAENKRKISTQFSDLADILRESNFWAGMAGSKKVGQKHVEQALEEKVYRSKMIEDKIQESIAQGKIRIETEGARVGQVNGLSVYQFGDYSFGKPSRITCQVGMGQSGIISIERDAELSGKSHTKGLGIISGYLRGMYAHDKPLNMSVSITFEQTYGFIDGDSASSTEIYAILSSLANLPLRQDIAVTGSVDQKGEIQPIGAVNEKIEGYYDVCRARGLTGKQGVIIPVQNVDNLMLRKDVTQDIKTGKFHLYAIRTIDEGIEILTGVSAGKRGKSGKFPKNSVHGIVERRLFELAERLKNFGAKRSTRGKKKST